MIAETIFCACAGADFCHHAVYPVLLRAIAGRRTAPAAIQPPAGLPSMTVIVPAHNEAAFIARKIANLAALRYPAGKVRFVIACDGCTDATVAIAKDAASRVGGATISIAIHEENIGKIAVLNEHIASCDAAIIVLSDASALVGEDALERLAAQFSDPTVGVVCGTYALPRRAAAGEKLYWAYQRGIKSAEAALAAPFGAHGAFYAFRREAWSPMEPDTINDDVILPMRIIAQGYRGIYDRTIVAEEMECSSSRQDFRRRMRLGAGNLQQAVRLGVLANPVRPGLAFIYLSGKALRAVMPFLGAAAALMTAALAIRGEAAFQAVAALGVLGVLACLLPYDALPRALQPVATFGRGYTAAFIGGMAYIAGFYRRPWRRVPQSEAQRGDQFIPRSVERSKRLLDMLCAMAALLVLCVVFPPLAIAIKLSSPGPVLYRQMRVGRITPNLTELFWLIKFRTMRQDAEMGTGPVWALDNDPRVTRLGRFMRKCRLDELPQCLNVLRGEMSIVGPRPERPGFFRRLEREIPFYIERTYGLKPGITGLAQINQAYDQTIEDVRNKVLFDHTYAVRLHRWMDWLACDVRIIFKTAAVMVTGRGAK
jgi:lipopolysaccharide/colanic/teichoic acid biosynthesis glycosyltransferase/GT2 family glycosyltransferase